MPSSCGSVAGYFAHRRRKEPACRACLDAFAAYVRANREQHRRTYDCQMCGTPCSSTSPAARFCRACASKRGNADAAARGAKLARQRRELVHVGFVPFTWLPPQHEVMRRIARPVNWNRKPGDPWIGFVSGPCAWCGTNFTATSAAGKERYCSHACGRRAAKAARRARERNADGLYTWTEVMRLFLAFNRCCAYCHQPIEGQPDPDHVVPLSRGGSNSITNILPACRVCNSDKNAFLLHEWAADCVRRGKPPVTTSWPVDDPRYRHVTSVAPVAAVAA